MPEKATVERARKDKREGEASPRRLANSFAKKWTIFGKGNMGPGLPNKPSRSGSPRPGGLE